MTQIEQAGHREADKFSSEWAHSQHFFALKFNKNTQLLLL